MAQQFLLICCVLLLLQGCLGGTPPVPVEERPQPPQAPVEVYVVEPGDTLYSIAWRYNMDFRRLAAANNIAPPYKIQVGRKIRLHEARVIASASRERPRTQPPPARRTGSQKPAKAVQQSTTAKLLRWHWPARGKLIARFSTLAPVSKGIDIAGKIGDAVSTAADGRVVYAGSGIRGYGRLVIIKHNERFLSAYAHNRQILVREGQEIKAGHKIGEMGEIRGGQPGLHFEIRKDGKPVDPLAFLPRS